MNKISIDPSNRKTQELLENYFSKSMSVLEPLKEKTEAADKLIDQIIYKLDGLTDEEIAIVEDGKDESCLYSLLVRLRAGQNPA